MKAICRMLASAAMVGLLGIGLAAQTAGIGRYDSKVQTEAVQKLGEKQQFRNVRASTEDGIVTLTGSVDLYQQKLDAAKRVRKLDKVNGVRNLIEVASTVPDQQLADKLSGKLTYDRVGYRDNRFNYITASVNHGVVTLTGETMDYVSRDSALAQVYNTPGVKDVVDQTKVLPTSIFDDQIRIRTERALYRDPVLSRYASDPAAPIRIVVNNGHVSLYGTVINSMDKEIAGIRAGQVFGVFSVQNNLEVAKKS